MKFILAFVECLAGLVLIGWPVWIVVTTPLAQIGTSSQMFYPYFLLSLGLIVFILLGVLLIIDAIKKGNK